MLFVEIVTFHFTYYITSFTLNVLNEDWSENVHALLCTGDTENIEKFNRRLVKVTKQHNEECKELLKLMGIPYIDVRFY